MDGNPGIARVRARRGCARARHALAGRHARGRRPRGSRRSTRRLALTRLSLPTRSLQPGGAARAPAAPRRSTRARAEPRKQIAGNVLVSGMDDIAGTNVLERGGEEPRAHTTMYYGQQLHFRPVCYVVHTVIKILIYTYVAALNVWYKVWFETGLRHAARRGATGRRRQPPPSRRRASGRAPGSTLQRPCPGVLYGAARAATARPAAPDQFGDFRATRPRLQARAPRRAEPEASSSRRPPRPAVVGCPDFCARAQLRGGERGGTRTGRRTARSAPRPSAGRRQRARDTAEPSTGVPSVSTTFRPTAFAARGSAKRTNPNRRLTPVWTSGARARSTAPQREKNHTRPLDGLVCPSASPGPTRCARLLLLVGARPAGSAARRAREWRSRRLHHGVKPAGDEHVVGTGTFLLRGVPGLSRRRAICAASALNVAFVVVAYAIDALLVEVEPLAEHLRTRLGTRSSLRSPRCAARRGAGGLFPHSADDRRATMSTVFFHLQVVVEPDDGVQVEMVRRLVEHQQRRRERRAEERARVRTRAPARNPGPDACLRAETRARERAAPSRTRTREGWPPRHRRAEVRARRRARTARIRPRWRWTAGAVVREPTDAFLRRARSARTPPPRRHQPRVSRAREPCSPPRTSRIRTPCARRPPLRCGTRRTSDGTRTWHSKSSDTALALSSYGTPPTKTTRGSSASSKSEPETRVENVSADRWSKNSSPGRGDARVSAPSRARLFDTDSSDRTSARRDRATRARAACARRGHGPETRTLWRGHPCQSSRSPTGRKLTRVSP